MWAEVLGKGSTVLIIRLPRRTPRLSALEHAFVTDLEAQNRTPGTIEHYRTRLRHLREQIGDQAVASIRADMLRRFLLAVKRAPHGRRGGPISDRYVEQHRKTLARFFGWCVEAGHLRSSPAEQLRAWRVDERELTVLRPDQVAQLLAAVPATFEGERDRAILSTLYGTGVRRRELVEISLGDVDLDASVVHVRRKVRRWRSVPLGPALTAVLRRYREEVRPRVLFGDSERLFVDAAARALRPNALNQMLRKLALRAGIRGQVSPHVFRHSFATEYLRNGGDRKALKVILDHTTDAMLDRYVHFVEADVQRDHAAASPFERLARPADGHPRDALIELATAERVPLTDHAPREVAGRVVRRRPRRDVDGDGDDEVADLA